MLFASIPWGRCRCRYSLHRESIGWPSLLLYTANVTSFIFLLGYVTVPRQFVYGHFVYGHFVYDTSSTDISSTDIWSTTVYQRTGQLYIQLLFHQIIIFINSNFYLHYDSFLSIPLPLTL